MDEERLKQAARRAAEILAQAKVTAARASQTLDRGKEARTVAAEVLSRARRAEVWAEAAIGRIRELADAPSGAGENAAAHDLPTDEVVRLLRHDHALRVQALARRHAGYPGGENSGEPKDPEDAPPDTTDAPRTGTT